MRREERQVHRQGAHRHAGGEPALGDRVRPLERVDRGRGAAHAQLDLAGPRRARKGMPRAAHHEAPDHDAGDRGGGRRQQRTRADRAPRPRSPARGSCRPARHRRHDPVGEVGDVLGGADPYRRSYLQRAPLERGAGCARRNVRLDRAPLGRRQVRAVHRGRHERLRAAAVHRAASSSTAIAAQSARRARNIRLFTVPTATPSTSAAS